MFVIMAYDIGEKRVGKVLKIARRYLHWVQRSVFEGEITVSALLSLKKELSRVIEPEEDTIRFYKLSSRNMVKVETLGRATPQDRIIL